MANNEVTFPTLYKSAPGGKVLLWSIAVVPEGRLGAIVTTYGQLDGKKQTMSETIEAGKNAGRKNATTPFQQAVAEAQSRWNKKKDRNGYGLTAEASAIVRGSSPMLAQVYEANIRKVDWSNAACQPKLDGFRLVARADDKGKVSLYSRENKPMSVLSHICETLTGVLTPGTTLDGEAYCHGMPLNKISSACKRRSELTTKIQYHVYDAMTSDPFLDRFAYVSNIIKNVPSDIVVKVETIKVFSANDVSDCLQRYLTDGYEGGILRHGRLGYEAGKRSSNLLKVKTWVDGEFKIVDVREGRGKMAGAAIFICETADGNPFESTAHGTIEEKQQHWRNRQNAIGKMLTVRYQKMTETDAPVPFQPVSVGFRE